MPKDARASEAKGFRCEVDAKAFTAALAQACRARATRTAVATLGGVRIDAAGGTLTLAATDMEMSCRVTMPATVAAAGSCVLADPRAVVLLAKTLAGPLTVERDQGGAEVVVISWTGARYTFQTLALEAFPFLPSVDGIGGTLDTAALREVLEHVLPVYSREESRPVLGGVRLTLDPIAGTIHAVATDSYRLAVYHAEGCEGAALEMTVPGRMLAEVLRLAKAKGAGESVAWSAPHVAGYDPTHIGFTVGTVEVVGRRVEGRYPNWRQLMPDSFELEASFSAAELVATAKRLSVVVPRNRSRGVAARLALDVGAGTVTLGISAQDGGSASEVLPTRAVAKWEPWNAKAKGEKAPKVRTMPEVGLNPGFLQDAAAFCGDTVRLRLISPLQPVLFLNGCEDCWHLLMPVRIAG